MILTAGIQIKIEQIATPAVSPRSGAGFQHDCKEWVAFLAAPAGLGEPEAGSLEQSGQILDTAADETDGGGRWCSEITVDAVGLSALLGYTMRTESGRPASIMRFRTATPMAASAC
jgi:hypothetical protein